MKHFIFSLFLAAFTLPTFAKNITPAPSIDGRGPKIKITIEVGRKSKNCERVAFCGISLETNIELRVAPIGEKTATGTAWMANGKLVIDFDRYTMTDATYQTYFASGNFIMEEDFELPADVAAALGVRAYTVKTGSYTVPALRSETNTFSVTF